MDLFCEECFSYLGPNRCTPCPQCGWKPEEIPLYPEPGKPLWNEPCLLDGHPLGRPVFSHGLILTLWRKGKSAGGLTSFDPQGNLRWQVLCGEAPLEGMIVAGERVYFCTSGLLDGGTVYCCKITSNRREGEILWLQNNPGVIHTRLIGKALLVEKRLYIPGSRGYIYCLDADQGLPVPGWLGQVEMDVTWLIAQKRDLLAVNRARGCIILVDPLRGRQSCSPFCLDTPLSSEPALWKNRLYVGSEDGRLFQVDARLQEMREIAAGIKRVAAVPVIANDMLFAGSQDRHLYAWDESGKLAWKSGFNAGHAISSSPAANDHLLAVGANDGKVYGVDTATGEKIWTFNSGLEEVIARDILYHNGVFYLGMFKPEEGQGYLFALPWHLGEYETIARRLHARRKTAEAASLFAAAAHYASHNREVLSEAAASCWIEAGMPRLAAQYWLGLAMPEKAAQGWTAAAEDLRGKDNLRSAEYYFEASRLYWRLGDAKKEELCNCAAVELGRLPRMRLRAVNNPVQIIGKAGQLTVRVENIGYAQALDLHFDVGGSLLLPISFNLPTPLDQDQHCDLSFVITPTRENDTVQVEVSYHRKDLNLPFKTTLDIQVQAKKVSHIELDGMIKGSVKIVNEQGSEMEIVTRDVVMSQIEIINKA